MSNKLYYKNLDLIRVIACIAILFFHLNLLKGGYLAVCVFFVLSAYLSCVSAFKKEKFSFFSYYKNRFFKLYLPLFIVVFLTLFLVSIIPNLSWYNLKAETTSVLLGYNNFWQLNANLDYFTRQMNSPFTHFWYISILIQFDLVFPFLFQFFRKIGDKISKILPCIITFSLSLIFLFLFLQSSLKQDFMFTYYQTYTRIFSLFFGLFLGFIHTYYKPCIFSLFKKESLCQCVFNFYIVLLIFLFCFIDSSSSFFNWSMIIVTFVTCRLIDYSVVLKNHNKYGDKIISNISKISYEIYLFQYPIIFFFQNINISSYIKVPILILLIFFVSFSFSLLFKMKKKKYKIVKYSILIIILSTCSYGMLSYFLAEDHTKEMKRLEEQLSQNEAILKEKQEEYISRTQEENYKIEQMLINLDLDVDQLRETITNLQIVGVGDSVMLGAVENLYQLFPNGYFDAKVSRTAWVVNGILQDLKNNNLLGETVLLNLGANGDCSESCKRDIMKTCEGKEVFWVNVTNDQDVHINQNLSAFALNYDNLHIIDWSSYSFGHSDYFVSDGIHLTKNGRQAYSNFIYESILQVYTEKCENKKNEILKQYQEELKNKISFYGNDLLLNAFSKLQENFSFGNFKINKNYNFESLKEEIKQSLDSNNLTHNLVFAFDKTLNLTSQEYQEIINLCPTCEVYILDMNGNINVSNANIINFKQEIELYPNYIMADGIHLSDEGNQKLLEILDKKINVPKN